MKKILILAAFMASISARAFVSNAYDTNITAVADLRVGTLATNSANGVYSNNPSSYQTPSQVAVLASAVVLATVNGALADPARTFAGNAATATTATNSPTGAFGTVANLNTNQVWETNQQPLQISVTAPATKSSVTNADNTVTTTIGSTALTNNDSRALTFTNAANTFAGTFNGNLTGGNGVTNGQPSVSFGTVSAVHVGVLNGLTLSRQPKTVYIFGDSLSLKGGTTYVVSYGGNTNQYAPTATNGTLYYTQSSYSSGTLSLWERMTNYVASMTGNNIALDTAASWPGQYSVNIAGGWSSASRAYEPSLLTGTYNSSGYYSNQVVGGFTCTWVPRSTNDLAVIDGGTTYITNVNSGVTFPMHGNYGQTYVYVLYQGTPGSNVTADLYYPYFSGQQIPYVPPYSSAANFIIGTNNISPSSWLDTNAPNTTGKPAAAILMAGGNDGGQSTMANNTNYNVAAFNEEYAGQLWWINKAKTNGYFPVYLVIYPRNFNFNSYTNDGNLTHSNTLLGLKYLESLERATPLTVVDGIIDLDATNINGNFTGNPANYIDGTHVTTNFASIEGTNVGLSMGWNLLLPFALAAGPGGVNDGQNLTNLASAAIPYRSGITNISNLATSQAVLFSTPFPPSVGTNYSVWVTFDSTLTGAVGFATTSKTTNGFTISLSAAFSGTGIVDYGAFLYR